MCDDIVFHRGPGIRIICRPEELDGALLKVLRAVENWRKDLQSGQILTDAEVFLLDSLKAYENARKAVGKLTWDNLGSKED